MKTKSLFRMALHVSCYIMVFLGTLLNANAQCPTVTNSNPAPICDAAGYTFADLNTFASDNGGGILWYDAPTGGNLFNDNELVSEGTYYADDNTGTCGTRQSITIDFVVDPTGQNLQGIYCSNDNATIQDYINDELQNNAPIGGSVEVYYDFDLSNQANLTDTLPLGFSNYFIVFINATNCRSQIEGGDTAVDASPSDPMPESTQEFCSNTNPTVGSLDPGTSENFNWYDNIDGNGDGIPPALNSSTPLIDGNTYYIQVETLFCDSNAVPVIVSIADPFEAGDNGNLEFCQADITNPQFEDLFPLLGPTADSNGTWSGPVATTNGNTGTVDVSLLPIGVSVFTYTVPANGACPEDTATVTITIFETFTSGTVSPLSPATFCESGLPTSFDLETLLDNEDPNGQWTDAGNTVISNPIDLSAFTSGTYNFTYTQNVLPNPCPEESTTVQVVVLQDPEAGNAVNDLLCENNLEPNPYDLFIALDGAQDNNNGIWTDGSGATVSNPIDISGFTVAGSPYSYTYTIDNGTCSDSETITITVEDAPESGTPVAAFPEFCEGEAPTTFDLFDLLDGEDQTGTWYSGTDNTGATAANPIDASVLTPGTYNYTFEVDAIGTCDDELVTVQITIKPLPNVGTVNNPPPFCENDPALNPINLFDYLTGEEQSGTWYEGSDATGTVVTNPTMVDLSSNPIGTYNYYYEINGANGCDNDATITIIIDDAPESGTSVATFPEFCEGEAPASFDLFDLLDGEDQTGTWFTGTDNTGATTANPIDASILTPGTYNYTFDVDAIGACDDELVTVQITINALPNVGTVNNPPPFCENDPALNPIDLFDYLTGEEQSGTWYESLDNSGAVVTNPTMVDLSSNPIGTYNYYYEINGANGCDNDATITIIIDDAPNAGTVNATPEFCISEITTGQTINLFDYLDNEDQPGTWSDNTPSNQLAGSTVTIDGLLPGIYTFTYDVDAIGACDDPNMPTVSIIINETAAPTAQATQDFCDAATVGNLAATGNNIQWYDDATGGTALDPATTLVDGETYYATQTDAATGCESSTRFEVTVTIVPLPNSGNLATSPIILCNDTTVDLNNGLDGTQDTGGTWMDDDATGAVTGSTFDANGITPGDYQFTYAVSAAPCADTSTTITVTVEGPLDAGTNGALDICNFDDGTTYDLFAQLGGTPEIGGTWVPELASTTGVFDPSIDVAGTYTYFLINSCGNATSEVVVSVTDAPNAGTNGTFTICAATIDATNNMLDLLTVLNDAPDSTGTFTNDDAANGFSGTILDLSIATTGTYNFTYTVIATAPCTMDVTAIATVTINDTAAATVVNANPAFCAVDEPTVADLDASVNGTMVTWYADATETTPLDATEALIDGEDYFASQNSANNCESSVRVQVNVSVGDAPTPTLLNTNLELCINDAPTINELTLNITEFDSALNNVVWYDASTNGNTITSTTELTVNTTYYAVLIDPVSGCESSVRLAVSPDLTGCGILEIPDGFSPNGDGVNDTFDMDNVSIIYPDFEIEIFNRYGNIVYKGNASTSAFNGKSNQSRLIGSGDLPVGVYYYIFNFNNGTSEPKQGRFYLSR